MFMYSQPSLMLAYVAWLDFTACPKHTSFEVPVVMERLATLQAHRTPLYKTLKSMKSACQYVRYFD